MRLNFIHAKAVDPLSPMRNHGMQRHETGSTTTDDHAVIAEVMYGVVTDQVVAALRNEDRR